MSRAREGGLSEPRARLVNKSSARRARLIHQNAWPWTRTVCAARLHDSGARQRTVKVASTVSHSSH